MLLHFLKFECKTEEKECMRLFLMENSSMRLMDVHCGYFWFWVVAPWRCADCWGCDCTGNCCVHAPRHAEISPALLCSCAAGCHSAGHDLLAAGAAAEEVGVLQQPGRSPEGQPHLPHTQRLLQRPCCQRQPRYVGVWVTARAQLSPVPAHHCSVLHWVQSSLSRTVHICLSGNSMHTLHMLQLFHMNVTLHVISYSLQNLLVSCRTDF